MPVCGRTCHVIAYFDPFRLLRVCCSYYRNELKLYPIWDKRLLTNIVAAGVPLWNSAGGFCAAAFSEGIG